jgi:misacylated tRNA(Ala) deacylase
MTELLFSKDSYMKEFDAAVIFSKEGLLELDRTAFYYTSGGQPCDLGRIVANGVEYAVLDTFKDKESGKILHMLDRELVSNSNSVHGVIDWERRFFHMRYHTALHILSKVVLDEFDNFVTSSQIYSNRARIDFDANDLTIEKIATIEEKANAVISQNLPVSISFIPREEALKIADLIRTKVNLVPESVDVIRVVGILGFDSQACSGTHVKSTGEVGPLKITKTQSKGKDRRRLEISLA